MKKFLLVVLVVAIGIILNEQRAGTFSRPVKCEPQIAMQKIEVENRVEVPVEVVKTVYTDKSCNMSDLTPSCSFLDYCVENGSGSMDCQADVRGVLVQCLREIKQLRKELK